MDNRATTTFQLQRTVFEDQTSRQGLLFVWYCDREYAPDTARSKYFRTLQLSLELTKWAGRYIKSLGQVYTSLPTVQIRQANSKMMNGKRAYLVKYQMIVGKWILQSEARLASSRRKELNSLRGDIQFIPSIHGTSLNSSTIEFNEAFEAPERDASHSHKEPSLTAEETMRLYPDQLIEPNYS